MGKLPQAIVQANGEELSIGLPREAGSAFQAGEALGVVAHEGEALLFLKENGGQGYIAGSLSALSVGEVFGLVVSGIRTGKLFLASGAARRTVTFRDGQIAFATSSEAYERLGRYLVRKKYITPGQLDAALDKLRPGTKLGQVLTHAKVLSPSALYSAIAGLVKEIVVGLFELESGHFIFFDGLQAPDAVKLPERTKDILLEGMRRAEQVGALRRRLPAARRVKVGNAGASGELAALAQRAARGVELGALRLGFEGSEYEFLVTVDGMLSAKALVEEGPAAPTPAPKPVSPAPTAAQLYASLIRTICTALKNAGNDLEDLREFLAEPLPGMEVALKGVKLSDEGEIDVQRVLKNVGGADQALARAAAFEVLDAFVSYALFSAKNVLPAKMADALAAEFRAIQRGLP
ncbi:MAG: DUF4388 domain-containing protein [Myxococcota bacterium]